MLSSFSETFNYIFPKFARKQFYHLILFLPHKIAPKKILHERSISVLNQILELLHPTHSLKIHRPFGSTYFPGVPKLVSPACEYNMNKNKNRVAQFHTKIDFLKLNSNCWFSVFFSWTAHGFDFYPLKIFINYLIFLSLSFWKHNYYGLCTSSIRNIRSRDLDSIAEHDL